MKGYVVAAILFLFSSPAVADAPPSLRVLICLDGVPFSMMEKVHANGFTNFRPPTRLISTFPALTDVMLTELYHLKKPAGYGLRYFDKSSNGPAGTISDFDDKLVWFKLYDYITPLISRSITFLAARGSLHDINRIERILNRQDTGLLLLHCEATDALMHRQKPDVTEHWLRRLDAVLEHFLAGRAAGDVEIVLFSDHGNDMTPTRRSPIEERLALSGFKPGNTIHSDSDVALLPTGLVSVGYLYTRREPEVCRALIGTPGLDLCLYEAYGACFVMSARGRAKIERSHDTKRYRYTSLDGDPLNLKKIMAAMRMNGRIDADGYADDKDWFEATLTHEYPDPLKRAYDGITGHVENVGDIMLSFDDGWQWGSDILTSALPFEGTHGSMTTMSSTGFVMSNARELTPGRGEDLLDQLEWTESVSSILRKREIELRENP